MTPTKGLITVISGPSGTGKGTLIASLMTMLGTLNANVSAMQTQIGALQTAVSDIQNQLNPPESSG